jgi:hypothetical protein
MCRIATVLLVCSLPVIAEAQELTASVWGYAPFGINDLGGELPPSAEIRVTLPLSERLSLEPFVTVGRHGNRRGAGVEGFYGAQIRHRIGRFTSDSTYAFGTYGVGAYYSTYGSLPPIIGHFGVGVHHRLFGPAAVRAEVQMLTFHVVPIGARYAAGFSLALGR